MVELREDRSRWLWLAAALLLAGLLIWFTVLRATDWRVRGECRARYAKARTAADTARVDEAVPAATRNEMVSPVTCGVLRSAGRLQ